MQSRDQHCGTRNETGSETAVEQLSQQVMIASSTIPLELCYEYSTPYDRQHLQKVQEILCKDTVNDEDKDIVISEKAARAIKGEAEFAFLREELASTEEIKTVICDGGATSTLSSWFENFTDCQPKDSRYQDSRRWGCHDNYACMHEDILRQVKDRGNSSDSDQGIHRSIAEI
jgi:hypothetical protein